MRLINVDTLEMEEYFDDSVPKFAILSHTWGKEEVSHREWTMLAQFRKSQHGQHSDFDGAVLYLLGISSFQDIEKRSGYVKIIGCCEQAKRDGWKHVWIDTCCIDKTSSAELSEAINSMFHWYKSSQICYVYLSDVHADAVNDQGPPAMKDSRWFSRGWTLQEFLAPKKLAFFDSQWRLISFKSDLVELLSSLTRISPGYIDGTNDIHQASVAQRMSWASKRQTTRKEDIAYCLIGMFDINIPLLYGEGERAFQRLQEAIASQSEDHSYLAWGFQMPLVRDFHGLFARSPADFQGCADVCYKLEAVSEGVTQMTNKGLQIRLLFWVHDFCRLGLSSYVVLRCCGPKGMWLALPLDSDSRLVDGTEVWRVPGGTPVALSSLEGMPFGFGQRAVTVVMKRAPSEAYFKMKLSDEIKVLGLCPEDSPFQLYEVFPPLAWIPSRDAYRASREYEYGGRFFMKLGPRHTTCSRTGYAIVTIDFQHKTQAKDPQSRIRPKVFPADKRPPDKVDGCFSLMELLYWEEDMLTDSLDKFSGETEVCGYDISVKVDEQNSRVVNISISSSKSKTTGWGLTRLFTKGL